MMDLSKLYIWKYLHTFFRNGSDAKTTVPMVGYLVSLLFTKVDEVITDVLGQYTLNYPKLECVLKLTG